MKNTLIAVGVLILILIGGYFLLTAEQAPGDEVSAGDVTTYSNPGLGIEFDYEAGPNGYVVQESTPTDPNGEIVRSIVLMRAEDVANGMPVGGEGPPTITIMVYKNAMKQSSSVWADAHTQYSNINLKMGDALETVVGGANAVRYMADGLYASENVVVAHGENVYVITGMFLDATSDLRMDYAPLVDSFTFIPATSDASQGKLNIQAVCEGALAYMTFESGAAAEKFVEECVQGEHPEVIEKYKTDNGLDGAVI
jgi:hypothetical protein